MLTCDFAILNVYMLKRNWDLVILQINSVASINVGNYSSKFQCQLL